MSKCTAHFSVCRYCILTLYFFPAPTNSYQAKPWLEITDCSYLSQQERKKPHAAPAYVRTSSFLFHLQITFEAHLGVFIKERD